LNQDKNFNLIKSGRPGIEGFEDTTSLLDFLADSSGGPDRKDRKDLIYAELVCLARSGGAHAELSRVLLWLGLWPGLDAIYRRNFKFHLGETDELVSELGAHFMRCVEHADLAQINWVAATLLKNTQRQLREARLKTVAHDSVLDPLPEHDAAIDPETELKPPPESIFNLPPGMDSDTAIERLRALVRDLVKDQSKHPDLDAELVIRVAIMGEDGREAGRNLGLTGDQGRKRYQRAIRRLRAAITRNL
jgi:RNA polymerase sigma-70 factor (ECF subfamily)